MRDEKAIAHPSVQKYAKHVNPAFVKLLGLYGYGRLFCRGRDVWVWDHEERRYLDALACFGAMNLGHNHPRIVARLQRFLTQEQVNFVHIGPSAAQGELAEKLALLAGDPLEVAAICNTGAEAVEGGIKIARAATGRPGIAFCKGGFHGTSLGTLSIMGERRMRKPFEPLMNDCVEIPFGSLEALKEVLATKRIAGFVVDPGMCEAGVVAPPEGYLAEAQALCRRYGTAMILDEVQTGLGRTGTLFNFQSEGFVPDILALAKSLSGGFAPIGATLTSADLHRRAFGTMERFDLHFTTFGGNAMSCAAAMETLDVIRDEGLTENSRAVGAALLRKLRDGLDGHPLVRDIRGKGLYIVVELGPTDKGWVNKLAPSLVEAVSKTIFGQWACVKLLERGVICQPASHHWNNLKIIPPLTFTHAHSDTLVSAFVEVLSEYKGVASLVKDATGRLGRQMASGWSF